MAESKALTEEHSQAEPHSGQPLLSYNCLQVQGVPPNYDEDDISAAVESAVGESVSVSNRRPRIHVSCRGSDAIVTMPAGCPVPEEIVLQHGQAQNSKVAYLFTETAMVQVDVPAPVHSLLASCIEKQAHLLRISVDLRTVGIIRAYGMCYQLHKFREYLATLLSNQARLFQPMTQGSLPQEQPSQVQIPEQVNPQLQEYKAAPHSSPPLPQPPPGARAIPNLSSDVLLLMPKLPYVSVPGVQYRASEGRVFFVGDQDSSDAFIEAYQKVMQTLKSTDIPIQAEYPREEVRSMVASYNQRYNQCHFLFNELNSTMKIVSASSRQFEQAKKFLTDIFCRPVVQTIEKFTFAKGRSLTVKNGNIVEEKCSVIVNAANSQLNHGGGVAGALNEASNGELQRHSDKHTAHCGPVPVGNVVQTMAGGRLKCKFVLHAVGPNAHEPGMDDQTCYQLIQQATTTALRAAQKLNAASIAFPALSTGIYGVSRSTAAKAMINAIEEFKYVKQGLLTDIRIVIIDPPTYTWFAQEVVLKRTQSLQGSTNGATAAAAAASQSSPPAPGGDNKHVKAEKGDLVSQTPGAESPSTKEKNSKPITSQPGSNPPPGFQSDANNHSTANNAAAKQYMQAVTGPENSTSAGKSGLPKSQSSQGNAGNHKAGGKSLAASFASDNEQAAATTPSKNVTTTATTAPPAPPDASSQQQSCPICLDKVTEPYKTSCCQNEFCRMCLEKALAFSPCCPTCKYPIRPNIGNQPDGTMTWHIINSALPGYNQCATIAIKYFFPDGIQNQYHPNPGRQYHGTARTAYLPNCREGQEVLALLKRAFDQRLVFTVGTSVTTGMNNAVVWNDIHHKTSMHGGAYGYPDDTYLLRVKDELKAKGIY